MQTLRTYEETSRQLVNKNKSQFMIHANAFSCTRNRFKNLTGFK
ncbi:hypothetical protein RDI58_024418 [Solanum bulbocastanum]|uniref:Uncharacterized protein n=1 Tax=Solanum bulbocastanum TaxID=147425 RepID=A0AAN8Y2Z0_SOLBU